MNTENLLDLHSPDFYINRELSWLSFNRRVVALAKDDALPLLERLRYLCICSSNLDEFFEVRVAGLLQQISMNIPQITADGLSPEEQLVEISEQAHDLVRKQYSILNKEIFPQLEEAKIRFLRRETWTKKQSKWIKDYFKQEVIPVISPLGLDSSHPFPRLINKSLNFVVTLEGVDPFGRDINVAVIQAPRVLPRIIRLPKNIAEGENDFVFLSSIIHAHVEELFPGLHVTGFHQFRVTRNTDLFVQEENIDDLLSAIKGELPQRNFGNAVRLEIADTCPNTIAEYLLRKFNLEKDALYQVKGPVNLSRMSEVLEEVNRPDLKFPVLSPLVPKNLVADTGIFDTISHNDILLHHPYQSFTPVIDFIHQAARDPSVLAIKHTVYRAGHNSPILNALMDAARSGKEVTVVIELRARFDEEANVSLADKLHLAGCQVVYGMVGYKTHAKLALVVRREAGKLVRYAHLGTGNYHAGTARLYTDYGYMTANALITEDVHKVFMQITGAGQVGEFNKLLVAPNNLHSEILRLIGQEAENAKAGQTTRIAVRMNALVEPKLIRALYRASQAGVKIDLIVRGVCALRPGVIGVSETITVRSILGRFLEHSRVFYFFNNGDPKMYLSSADWMPRNCFRRVETAFPIESPEYRGMILEESIENHLKDNVHSWQLLPDGTYQRIKAGEPHSSQNYIIANILKK